MPELPEVETVVRNLLHFPIIGLTIESCSIYHDSIIYRPHHRDVLLSIKNKKIIRCERKGKYILLFLESGIGLFLHLGMSGRLIFLPKETSKEKHEHFSCTFRTCSQKLSFIDPRRFGRIGLIENGNPIAKLGIDPFDTQFQPELIFEKFSKSTRSIKTLLLEQDIIAGIGNIYADEALFRAKIHPLKPGRALSKEESIALHTAILNVLSQAIIFGGSSLGNGKGNFHNAHQEFGQNQTKLAVYKKNGKKCVTCCSTIERIVINGRSSHFCSKCQKNSNVLA